MKSIVVNGKYYQSIAQACRELGYSSRAITSRLQRMSVDEAFAKGKSQYVGVKHIFNKKFHSMNKIKDYYGLTSRIYEYKYDDKASLENTVLKFILYKYIKQFIPYLYRKDITIYQYDIIPKKVLISVSDKVYFRYDREVNYNKLITDFDETIQTIVKEIKNNYTLLRKEMERYQ